MLLLLVLLLLPVAVASGHCWETKLGNKASTGAPENAPLATAGEQSWGTKHQLEPPRMVDGPRRIAGVFWDSENVVIPRNYDAGMAANDIFREASKYGELVETNFVRAQGTPGGSIAQ
jgi:hypothetical protein